MSRHILIRNNLNPHVMESKTPTGEVFSAGEASKLAFLIHKKFGRDFEASLAAWQRMLRNNSDLCSFRKLVSAGEELMELEEQIPTDLLYWDVAS